MLTLELDHPTLQLGVLRAARVRSLPSDQPLLELMAEAERRAQDAERAAGFFPEQVRSAVRDMLRVAGYKPTGRGKPASELLFALAQKGALPRIRNLVDINNLTSLEYALPISMFDADMLGALASVRFGRAGEQYVFNAAGHSMELAGLPLVCRGVDREPVGNPVRDSMLCKVHEATTSIVAVVYASRAIDGATVLCACERLRNLLERHAHAEDVSVEPPL